MLEVLKEIILDFQKVTINAGFKRLLDVKPVKNKATICIGVRRSGKSTYMLQIIQKLLSQGIPKENILHLNFFDDRLHPLQHDKLNLILEAYFSLYPAKKNSETIYCFFDEIQVLPGWEVFVNRLMRTELCEVYITGSSAKMLSKEIATEMRGRALSWEVFPFSFHEFLTTKQIKNIDAITSKKRFLIQNAFEDYWQTGAFPEVFAIDKHLRIKIHQEYFNTILFRDLVERHDISHPKALSDLAHWLTDNTASLYSVNSLTGYLKALGHKVSRAVISDYMSWFEDAYFFFSVRIFDASLARSNTNPKKIYCIDHGLVTSVSSGILINAGHLLENLIFITLRRVSQHIFYYKTKTGKEVDFITKLDDATYSLIQVCETLADPETKKREIAALKEAMFELNLSTSYIVTRYEEDTIQIGGKMIQVIPAWRFMLKHSM